MERSRTLAVVKGAGDLATGAAFRLFKCGVDVIMTEIERPLVVRRTVAFAEAVFTGSVTVEGVTAALADSVEQAQGLLAQGVIPVCIDPEAEVVGRLRPTVVVDAIMAKKNINTRITDAPLVVGLGPGFTAGLDVHVVIETNRGHNMGRVIRDGSSEDNTGVPGEVIGFTVERLLRAPEAGVMLPVRQIGEWVNAGEVVALVGGSPVTAEISGLVRGMLKAGVWAAKNSKIGDIDPRASVADCHTISDKALAVGGGVLEAVFAFLHTSKVL